MPCAHPVLLACKPLASGLQMACSYGHLPFSVAAGPRCITIPQDLRSLRKPLVPPRIGYLLLAICYLRLRQGRAAFISGSLLPGYLDRSKVRYTTAWAGRVQVTSLASWATGKLVTASSFRSSSGAPSRRSFVSRTPTARPTAKFRSCTRHGTARVHEPLAM